MGRPKSDKATVRLSVSLDEADYVALRDLAEGNDVSAAWIVRRAVSDFLKAQTTRQGIPLTRAVGR